MNATLFRGPVAWLIAAAVVILGLLSTFVIVPETEQAVILRARNPRAIINAYQPNEQFGRTGAGIT